MSDDAQSIIDETFSFLLKTYEPQPVVLDHGSGIYAYDTQGKEYLDFAAGIAVASLGHAHPAIIETLTHQAGRMMAVQNSYATREKLEAARILVKNSCFDLVYFCNSGTEAVESALKCARKWAYDEKGEHATQIIAFRNSFHGRTYGAASVTEKRMSQPFFGPYLPDVQFAQFNDIESVKSCITPNTAAIIVEPVQGEGGLAVAHPCFLGELRALCDLHNICLIYDEVQAGMGRLGTFFAYQDFACCHDPACNKGEHPNALKMKPVEPDIACLAKGMGSGFPVGAMVAKERYGRAIVPGTHGTTYGGNPLACAVASTVMSHILSEGFLANVRHCAELLHDGLHAIQRKSNKVIAVKGKGLMAGLDTTIDIKTLLRALQSNGLMATQAGKSTLRLTPPLIITPSQIHAAIAVIEKTLAELPEVTT